MDITTVSIAVGLLVSLLFAEIFGLAAGGMIVPGYFALYMDQPSNVLVTIVAALVTFALVRSIARYVIIYGRRRIVMMILVGFLVGCFIRGLAAVAVDPGLSHDSVGSVNLCVIGFIIPGLIALWIDRQGATETLAALITSATVVRLVLIVLGLEVVA